MKNKRSKVDKSKARLEMDGGKNSFIFYLFKRISFDFRV